MYDWLNSSLRVMSIAMEFSLKMSWIGIHTMEFIQSACDVSWFACETGCV